MKHGVRVTHARPRMNQPIINLKINSPEFSKTLTRLRSTAVLYRNRGGNKCPELLRMGKRLTTIINFSIIFEEW